MTKGQNVKLQKNLYAGKDGGVATGLNQNKNLHIELVGPRVAHFPLNAGTVGVITDVSPVSITVDYGNAVLKFQKFVYGEFNQLKL